MTSFDEASIPLPDEYGGSFRVGDKDIDVLFSWLNPKVAIIDRDIPGEIRDAFIKAGWKIVTISEASADNIKHLLEI